jgi:hypothetical protein
MEHPANRAEVLRIPFGEYRGPRSEAAKFAVLFIRNTARVQFLTMLRRIMNLGCGAPSGIQSGKYMICGVSGIIIY